MSPLPRRFAAAAKHPALWLPLLVLGLTTILFWCTDFDIAVARLFFSGESGTTSISSRWPLMRTQPWKSLYDFGVYPALAIGGGGLLVWLASFIWTRLEPLRDPGLFLALVLIIGPGILVNGCLKPFWNRPRPHAIQAFNGPRPFLPVLQRGDGQNDSSFPSGHAAMGFYLMAPAFLLYPQRRGWALAFLLIGLGSGLIIGLARIVAGGHFASDVLWSAAVVYFTALVVAAPFGFGQRSDPGKDDKRAESDPLVRCG